MATYPDPSEVLSGVQYGPNDTDYTGTLSGLSVEQEAKLDAIKAQTDLITTSQLSVVSPFASSSLTIKRGDTYSTAAGQTLTIAKPSGASWPSDLTDWTVTFRASVIADRLAGVASGDDSEIEKEAVVAVATGSQSIRIDLTAADTGTLHVGGNVWEWALEAVHATNGTNTLISGTMTVVTDA